MFIHRICNQSFAGGKGRLNIFQNEFTKCVARLPTATWVFPIEFRKKKNIGAKIAELVSDGVYGSQ